MELFLNHCVQQVENASEPKNSGPEKPRLFHETILTISLTKRTAGLDDCDDHRDRFVVADYQLHSLLKCFSGYFEIWLNDTIS
jgi:hypothetical protein